MSRSKSSKCLTWILTNVPVWCDFIYDLLPAEQDILKENVDWRIKYKEYYLKYVSSQYENVKKFLETYWSDIAKISEYKENRMNENIYKVVTLILDMRSEKWFEEYMYHKREIVKGN